MLEAYLKKSCRITSAEREENSLYLYSERGMYRLLPKYGNIVQITYTERENFSDVKKPGIIDEHSISEWHFSESDNEIFFRTNELTIIIQKETASFSYYDKKGKLMLKERDTESKELESFTSYRIADGAEVKKEVIQTADGKKEIIKEAAKEADADFYHTRMHLCFKKDEALFGLGQQEEGNLNLRGKTVYVHQANKKIAIPLLLSSLGYGLLVDTYSPMIFNDTEFGSYLYTEADYELDYYFILGNNMNDVVSGYRQLTGKAVMLPKWAFGYIQSQERFESADEIISVAEEYRRREIGLDALVLDWCSWEDGLWGQKTFDAKRFPDPNEMINKLHDNHIHFMISVWPNASENCKDYQEFEQNKLHLPCSEIYNAVKSEGRELYWKQLETGLYSKGVDSWWCDSSEPFTPEWNHFGKTEPAKQYSEFVQSLGNFLPAWQTNAFCLYHAQAIYEGQRSSKEQEKSEKRVMNLTRSGYTGQQRYGTVLWSGDISASWNTFKKQIPASLNFCASGLPYWTVDIGAFFVKHGAQWYWDGDYNKTTEDLGYRELFVRWYQWGCFLPIFRGHGTDCRRELWQFGDEGNMFYDALVKTNKLRYELMPYIYSQAGKVWMENASFIKMLAFDFPNDSQTFSIKDQYLFGDSIMVCPVTTPMYYDKDSAPITNAVKTRNVYLPEGTGWYDYWTNSYYEGGTFIDVEVTLDQIPLFVKEGSIIPVTESSESTENNGREITLSIYTGIDASYTLYEDAGDGYGYEKGEYALTHITWNEETSKVTIEKDAKSDPNCFNATICDTKIIKK